MPDPILEVLQSHGPCLSTDLAEMLVSEHGLTPAAARQRISRHQEIKRLAFLPFPRNARFVYLQKDYGSPWFWEGLSEALIANTISHGGALAALIARDGIMPLKHFEIACGAPRAQKKHLSPAIILERLQRAGLLQVTELPDIGPCVALAQQFVPTSDALANMRARLIVEDILLKAVRTWLKNLSFASYKKIAIRDDAAEQPRVGTFHWDLTGPSYLAPMLDWTTAQKMKPGFIACDVLLGSEIKALHLRPFVNKCKTLRSLKGVGRCLQIFVANRYDKEAFMLAKESGIVPATPETLFGEEVAATLVELTHLLSTVAKTAVDPLKFDEIFTRLSKIEGAAINLRGALFEFLVAEIVRQTENGTDLRMNEIFREPGGRAAEVDVLVVTRNRSVRFIECKGYKPGGVVPDELVRKWLDERIQIVRKCALTHPDWKSSRLRFEFWTTGILSPAAKKMVDEVQATVSAGKYTVVVHDRDSVAVIGKQTKDLALQKTLAEHFLEHPFETIERDLHRRSDRQRLRDMRPADATRRRKVVDLDDLPF